MRWATALLLSLLSAPAAAERITDAAFIGPTDHYAHGILGDAIEWSGMTVSLSTGGRFLVGFSPGTRVFEDVAPRLWDVTGDGAPEIVVVETDPPQGAQLAVYGLRNGAVEKIAATPHIGQRNRWLAPIGAADLDGDGLAEIAYIDRPHLAKILRVWRFKDGTLTEVASLAGFTNHRIGERDIAGGIRTCDGTPEMIVARADWRQLVAVTFDGTSLRLREIGIHEGRGSFARALECD